MTTIKLSANDQVLSPVIQPKIASGDINSVLLQVDFDDGWDGYKRTAVFFTSLDETVYKADLTDDQCIVPYEVLAEPGTLFIGVRGVKSDNTVKTTILVKYKIELGAPNGVKEPGDIPPGGGGGGGDPGGPIDPTRIPDMYYTEEVELLPETALTFAPNEDMGGMNVAMMVVDFTLQTGEEYTVVYNGTKYTCEALGFGFLGNASVEGGEDTGEPFAIIVVDDSLVIIPLEEITTATLQISGSGVTQIPEKYIPDALYFDATQFDSYYLINGTSTDIKYSGLFAFIQKAYKKGVAKIRLKVGYDKNNLYDTVFSISPLIENGDTYKFNVIHISYIYEFYVYGDDTLVLTRKYGLQSL